MSESQASFVEARKLFNIDRSIRWFGWNSGRLRGNVVEIFFPFRRLELLERLSKGAKDTHVPGDRRNIRNHAHDAAHLLADTVEEAGNAPCSIQQAPNFLHEIDHHRVIMLPARLVRDGWVVEEEIFFVQHATRVYTYVYLDAIGGSDGQNLIVQVTSKALLPISLPRWFIIMLRNGW